MGGGEGQNRVERKSAWRTTGELTVGLLRGVGQLLIRTRATAVDDSMLKALEMSIPRCAQALIPASFSTTLGSFNMFLPQVYERSSVFFGTSKAIAGRVSSALGECVMCLFNSGIHMPALI